MPPPLTMPCGGLQACGGARPGAAARAPGVLQPLLHLTGLGESVVRQAVCTPQGHARQDHAESDPHRPSGRWLVSW